MYKSVSKWVKNIAYLNIVLLVLASCSSYKKAAYLQTTDKSSEQGLHSLYETQGVKFQAGDILSITVNAEELAAVEAFNLPLLPAQTGLSLSSGGRQTYLVDDEGNIDFPVLGSINVLGMGQSELAFHLKKDLRKYLKSDPILTIRLINFRISVIGEVLSPGVYNISKEKVNLLEALSLAGDMTIQGERKNIVLMRESDEGLLKVVRLDISSIDILSSPYFYLKQNDVIYVVPNKAKSRSADISSQTSILLSLGSVLLSVANLIVLLVKK
ncbi:polysaccharide export outer membrane protein [Bacteroidales bacterium]|nr:polysaccharide export outer membrane protein [Bacteroidales bacterium]